MPQITIAVRNAKTHDTAEFTAYGSLEKINEIIAAVVEGWDDGGQHVVNPSKESLNNDRVAVCLQPNTATGAIRGVQTSAGQLKMALAKDNIHTSEVNTFRSIVASGPCNYMTLEDGADHPLPYREP